jgi:glutaredoxin
MEFTERDVSRDPQAVQDLVETYQSRSTPTLVIGEEVMIGFDPEKLEQLLAE